MIKGIGIDATEISRFAHWHTYPHSMLRKVFAQVEIDHCLKHPVKSAERFAARFAVREALFKALSHGNCNHHFTLWTLAKNCYIINDPVTFMPFLKVDWAALELPEMQTMVTFTHTRTEATAIVVLQ